ncbi:MAG: glycosyltransferase family 8 protein [Alphaproteobacteria bacterium]|nr:glycosyltransferase family 8 protein [Alphaproteobacteria bacterium]
MKSDKSIAVAFCFDENMWMLAGVAIASLLYHGIGHAPYNIYCVVPKDLGYAKREELSDLVQSIDARSTIVFLDANDDFDASVTKQYTVGIYYRFMLAKLLPDVSKIIYCDADVSFSESLEDLYDYDMGENLIAGVRDADQGRPYPSNQNGYVNSGVLLMNLDEIRRNKMYERWMDMSKSDEYAYPDQDILNKTCDGRILYLPLKYNYMCGTGGRLEARVARGVYSAQEVIEAKKNPVIVHYILRQPWKGRANLYGHWWWRYAAMTPFFEAFRAQVIQKPDVEVRKVLLFNFINIMTIKIRQHNIKCYLFGKLPLCRIKTVW